MIGHWEKINDVVADALLLPSKERRAFLASGLVDADLTEAESLISVAESAASLLEAPAITFSKDFFPEEERLAGKTVGPFTIVRELGHGGMGAVYLAERHDGKFDQKVAIKMLRRELDTAAIRKNFDREKNILAALVHPNIASLLDTGETDEGIPYLTMEFIEGIPVDEFCVKNDLGLTERLKLFNKVCEAVAFAHRNLIVHRDIKPSNILVTSDGTPKLLDFGISKILDDDGVDSSTTLLGAMTPEYASPEQINGHTVTTATDVYSLGIVLYKMLTRMHPFKRKGRSNDLLRAITEDEPTAPSLVETDVDGSPASFSVSHLKGDIDNIVLKAIRKDPERRYNSVEAFSADVWRYIDGKPVEARPATSSYRLGKFYKRNKIAVTAGVLIVAALVGGVSVALWQASVARANAAVAIAESENAKAEQEKAERVSKFMMRFVRYANPKWYAEGHKFGGNARVIDALNDMGSKIDTEFADQPDVLAELHHQFGEVYYTRGEPGGLAKAQMHFKRALELRRAYYGDWHQLVAKDMAYVYWAQNNPHPEWSVKMLSDAIVMMRATDRRDLNLPFMLEDYFHRLTDEGNESDRQMYLRNAPQPAPNDPYLAADQLFDEMLGLLRTHFPEDDDRIEQQKCAGAELKRKVKKFDEAEAFYRDCAEAIEHQNSTDSPVPRWQEWLDNYERSKGVAKTAR